MELMRVVLSGQKRFGRDVLRLLLERGDEVLAVACPVLLDDPDKLFIEANNHGLRIIPSGQLNRDTMPEHADLIIAAHSHDFIGRPTRDKTRLGALGYHPSLLPRHRGRSSIEWALRFGEKVTGGTLYWLNDVVDGGPIAAQDHVHIRSEDTARDLWARELAPLGLRLFRRTLRELDADVQIAVPQDHALATWEPAIDRVPRLFRPDLLRLGGGGPLRITHRDDAENFREGTG